MQGYPAERTDGVAVSQDHMTCDGLQLAQIANFHGAAVASAVQGTAEMPAASTPARTTASIGG